MAINHDRINTLPSSLRDCYISTLNELADVDPTSTADVDPVPTLEATVPNIQNEQTEVNMLLNAVSDHLDKSRLRMPTLQCTPPSEHTSRRVLAMAFPTLFPRGTGDWHEPRVRTVTFREYVSHLMRYSDQRFATHPRFRYVLFNRIMRDIAHQRSNFYIKSNRDVTELSMEQLEQALQPDTEDSLLDAFIRAGRTLPGTRSLWKKCS